MTESAQIGVGMRAVRSALRVLEAVAAAQPAGVSALSRTLGLPKSTVQRCLLTLAEADWLVPSTTAAGRWVLSPRAWTVGCRAPLALDLREAALAPMQELRDATGETIHLSRFAHDSEQPGESILLIVERLDSTQPVRTFVPLGTRAPLHATCSGRAVLAAFPDAEVGALIGADLESFTESTPTDVPSVLAHLSAVRRDGYSINGGEWRAGVGAVAAAVLGPDRIPAGALVISVPQQRFDRSVAARFGPLVAAAADRISGALTGPR